MYDIQLSLSLSFSFWRLAFHYLDGVLGGVTVFNTEASALSIFSFVDHTSGSRAEPPSANPQLQRPILTILQKLHGLALEYSFLLWHIHSPASQWCWWKGHPSTLSYCGTFIKQYCLNVLSKFQDFRFIPRFCMCIFLSWLL